MPKKEKVGISKSISSMKFIKLVRYQKQFPDGVSDMSPGFAVLQPVSLGLAVKLGPDGECLVQTVHTPDHGVTSEQSFHNIQRRPLLGPSPC